MAIIVAILLSIVLLYFWLIGHWFARVLVFLGLAGPTAFLALIVVPPSSGGNVGVAAVCGVVAWFVAGIPIYYWRGLQRQQIQRGLEMLYPSQYQLIPPQDRSEPVERDATRSAPQHRRQFTLIEQAEMHHFRY